MGIFILNEGVIHMTNKLYYVDPYIQAFSATILKQTPDYVVLSETAFYPTGGGQPHDTGTINGIAVTNVEIVDGEIRHYLAAVLPKNTEHAEGLIDWNRRLDHMQQHAGQHILSAAFDNLFEWKTVSFHLGKETSTIDLDVSDISEDVLQQTETLANEIVLENRPIETKWVTEEELGQYKLRKATKITEDIRLVIVPDFDYNACGGTHPSTTGQIGLIKILRVEKQKRIIRVEFVCGNRVLSQLHRKQGIISNLIGSLSSPEDKLENTVQSVLANNKMLEKQLANLKDSLLQYEAKDLTSSLGQTIITRIFQNRTIQELQKLGKYVTSESTESICILVSENETRLQVVVVKGSSVNQNMKQLLEYVLPLINGKGGGNNTIAQGGGESTISGEQLIEKIVKYITL